jgi:osmotically-inducible protein OsmY
VLFNLQLLHGKKYLKYVQIQREEKTPMKTKHAIAMMTVVSALMIPGLSAYATDDRASKETIGEKIDDAVITSKVKVDLMNNSSTSALKTEVDTVNGVVTLTGEANSMAEKNLATEVARKTKGVKKVNNKMIVKQK